jgi:hypothetical protein
MDRLADIRVDGKFAITLLHGERVLCYVKADDSGYYMAHDNRHPAFLFDLADIDAPVFQQRVLGYYSPVFGVHAFPRCKTLDDLRILLHHLLRQLPHRGITNGLQDFIRLPYHMEVKPRYEADTCQSKSWNEATGMMKHEEEACKASTDPVTKIYPMKPVILSKNKNELSLFLSQINNF